LDNRGAANLTNCTFAAGTAVGGAPGNSTTDGVIYAPEGEAGFSRGGNIAVRSGTLRIKNSLLAYTLPAGGKNAYGTLLDLGYNISSDDSCLFSSFRSRNSVDPKLGTLDDYGGPTETMALLVGSPALDKAAPVEGLDTDQRGSTRPVGVAPDIGAYEAAVFVVSGRVLNGPQGLAGVKMTLTSTNYSFSATTDANGLFVFENLFADIYRLAPPKTGASYTPPFRTIHLDWLGEDAVNQDFSVITSEIIDLQFDGQLRVVTAQGVPKASYLLQATSDFTQWDKVATNTADSAGSLQFIDRRPGVGLQQFYRLEQR
jgi:hypothetical protein